MGLIGQGARIAQGGVLEIDGESERDSGKRRGVNDKERG
jgi:hypothetical protein